MSSPTSTVLESQSVLEATVPKSLPDRRLRFHRGATFLSLMLGYAGYYLCRQNLGVAYSPMKAQLGITPIEFGWLSSLGTLTYAIGKVTVGSLADSKLGGKFIFLLGLFVSAAFCLVFGLGKGLTFFIITWSLCRFSQSMGWSGLVNIMSQWYPKKSYGTAMGLMSVSYQFGGVLVSLYAGLILSWGGGESWRSLFIIPALTLIGMGLLILPFLKGSPREVGLSIETLSSKEELSNSPRDNEFSSSSYGDRIRLLLSNRAFLGMLSLSFVLTFLRECFNVWMPAYFSELGEAASVAALKSTVFPFLGCLGTLLGGWASDRFLSGRRSPVMAVLMLVLVFCLIGLANLESMTTWVHTHHFPGMTRNQLATLLVGASGFFLLGSYSFVGGVAALDFGGKKTAGTAAGLLDGVGYLGGTLAGAGFASSITYSGWNSTFLGMAGFCVVGIFICLGLLKKA